MKHPWRSFLAASCLVLCTVAVAASTEASARADSPTPYYLTSSPKSVKSWQHASWNGECADGYYVNGKLDTYSFVPYVWINGADDISLSEAKGTESFVDPTTGIHFQGLYVRLFNSDLLHAHTASFRWQCVPVGTSIAPADGSAHIIPGPFSS